MKKTTENINVRRLDSIIEELFKPMKGGSALDRYAKVRHTLYEIQIWREQTNMPISEIPAAARNYFCERFLDNTLSKASETEINDAIIKLGYAENSCKKRCTKIVEEFNAAVREYNNTHSRKLAEVCNIEKFLDFYTFNYDVMKDHEGKPVLDKPYTFEIRIFHDKENRSDAWYLLKRMLENNRVASMQNVYRLNKMIKLNSVKI